MTLGIGIMPRREPGVVLLADGMNVNSEGMAWQGDDKLLGIAECATALVVSGYTNTSDLAALGIGYGFQAVRSALSAAYDPMSQPVARRLFEELRHIDAECRARRPGHDRYAELDDPGPHAIVAALQPGRAPLLGRFTSKTERWAKPGDAFVVGCVELRPDLVEEMGQPAPDTLAECKAWAVDWTGRLVDTLYGQRDALETIRETGQMPTIGFPLQAVTIRETNFDLEEIA